MIKVNYDSGNSASLGYDPTDEFAAYGERVGSVHIKDRVAAEAPCRSAPAMRTSTRSSSVSMTSATGRLRPPGGSRRAGRRGDLGERAIASSSLALQAAGA